MSHEGRIPKVERQKELIYELRLENKKLKDLNEGLKNRLSDVSHTSRSNKELLIEMSDKFNAQLIVNHKLIAKKTEQYENMSKQKDEIIHKLRENFDLHMNALKFTWKRCGRCEYKTELWKDGLDKLRIHSQVAGKNSQNTRTAADSKTIKDNFFSIYGSDESKFDVSGTKGINEDLDEEKDNNDTTLKTFRIIVNDTSEAKNPLDKWGYEDNDGTVIVYDVSPAKLWFTSENDEGMSILSLTSNHYLSLNDPISFWV